MQREAVEMGAFRSVLEMPPAERRGFDIAKAVRRTQFGRCHAAKMVLVTLGQCADPEGLAFPSRRTMAKENGLSLRSVHRAIQCMRALGLLTVAKYSLELREQKGLLHSEEFHLNLAMLGHDLTEAMTAEWRRVEGKDKGNVTDGDALVQAGCEAAEETQKAASETLFCVSGDTPPDPLLGRTTNEPPVNHQCAARDLPEPQTLLQLRECLAAPACAIPESRDVAGEAQVPAERAWRAVQGELRNTVPVQSYATWLRPTHGTDLRDGVLRVSVPTELFGHVGERFRVEIREAIAALGLPVRDVQFAVAEPVQAAPEPRLMVPLQPRNRLYHGRF